MELILDEQEINSATASNYYRNQVKRYLNQSRPVFAYGKITIVEAHRDSAMRMKGFYLIELPPGTQSTAPFMWMINHLNSGTHEWESFGSHPKGANTLLEIRLCRQTHPVMIIPDNFVRKPGNKYAKHLLEKIDD